MELAIYRSNAALPEHLRGQILALIRIGFHETAGDYRGPEALPAECSRCTWWASRAT
jgi:hypothetical protein